MLKKVLFLICLGGLIAGCTNPAGSTVPVLLFPEEGSLHEESLILDWEDVAGATLYTVEFSTKSDFSEIYSSYTTGDSAFNLEDCYLNKRQFWWRVSATSSSSKTSDPSEIRSFFLYRPAYSHEKFSLTYPVDTTIETTLPGFEWTRNRYDTDQLNYVYWLEISKNKDFSSSLKYKQNNGLTFQLTEPLENDTTYYWRVFNYIEAIEGNEVEFPQTNLIGTGTGKFHVDINAGIEIIDYSYDEVEITFSSFPSTISNSCIEVLSATASQEVDSYSWYLDGMLLPDETGAKITINGQEISEGIHQLALVITCGDSIESKEISFIKDTEPCPAGASYENSNETITNLYYGTTTSTNITVAREFDCPIQKIRVKVNITHYRCEYLDIYLIAPDGTEITLSSGNGNWGDHFRDTEFDDEAALSVISGSPPFAGSYQPEGSLAALKDKAVSGVWTLKVVNDYNYYTYDQLAYLNSWTLMLDY